MSKRAQRAGARNDSQLARHVAHAERDARVSVERERGSGEARRGRNGRERAHARGGGEKLGGGSEREHGAP